MSWSPFTTRKNLALQGQAGIHASSLHGRLEDVTDNSAVEQFVSWTLAKYGRLDALVNAVGGYAGGVKL